MRSWMLITAIAVVVGVGGLVYYIFPRSPVDAPRMPPKIIVQPEQKTGNPLLTASYEQFSRWFPNHCEAALYFRPTENAHTRDVCIFNVTQRVESSTGVRLTRNDILDPAVLEHWKQVTGAR